MWFISAIGRAVAESISHRDSVPFAVARLFTTGMPPAFIQLIFIYYPPLYKPFEHERRRRSNARDDEFRLGVAGGNGGGGAGNIAGSRADEVGVA